MIYQLNDDSRNKIAPLFENMNSTILLSCLQGHMGKAWVDDLENPTVAQVMVGIFVFYGGDANSEAAKELLYNLPEHIEVIVDTDDWKKRIETLHKRIEKFDRFEFEKNPKHLDSKHLQGYLSTLPDGYELKKIDEALVNEDSLHKLSPEFTGQFDSVQDFLKRGVGFCIVHKGQIVSGASSYSIYDNGLEIEVATDAKHRKKGLATVVSSALILDCIDKGIYPNWDAANIESLNLGKKLGYVFKQPYDTYYINYKKNIRE